MDTYIYIYIGSFLVFIDVTFQLLPETEYVHSGCYGNLHSSLMNANCSAGEVIAPIEVSVGSKTNVSGCPAVAQIEFTPLEFQRCCTPNNDGCVGVYQRFGDNSNLYKDDCVGRTQCSARQVAFMDTLHLGCNQTVYLPQTNFMYMNYYCISESKIGKLPAVNLQSHTTGSFLYLQGQSYPSEIMTSSIVCSVETQCENTITIYAVDIRLSNSSSGSCNQELSITDGVTSKSVTCNDNNDYVISSLYTSQKNYLNLTFNSSISTGGFFWIGITASNGSLTLNCPLQSEIYQCETTTEEQTTTTTPEETTTTSDVTSVETTTETTPITENNTEMTTTGYKIQTTTTVIKPGASTSANDITLIIVGVVGGVIGVIVIAVLLLCFWKRKNKNRKSEENKDVEKDKKSGYTNNSPTKLSKPKLQNESDMQHAINKYGVNKTSKVEGTQNINEKSGPLFNYYSSVNSSVDNVPLSGDNKERKKKKKKKKRNKIGPTENENIEYTEATPREDF